MTVEMINLHKSYVAKLGFELVTTGSAVRSTTDCATAPLQLSEALLMSTYKACFHIEIRTSIPQ